MPKHGGPLKPLLHGLITEILVRLIRASRLPLENQMYDKLRKARWESLLMPDAMLPYGKLPHEIKMDEVIKVGEAKSLRVSSSPADSRLILATLGSDAYKICHPVLIPNLYMILEIYPLVQGLMARHMMYCPFWLESLMVLSFEFQSKRYLTWKE